MNGIEKKLNTSYSHFNVHQTKQNKKYKSSSFTSKYKKEKTLIILLVKNHFTQKVQFKKINKFLLTMVSL